MQQLQIELKLPFFIQITFLRVQMKPETFYFSFKKNRYILGNRQSIKTGQKPTYVQKCEYIYASEISWKTDKH